MGNSSDDRLLTGFRRRLGDGLSRLRGFVSTEAFLSVDVGSHRIKVIEAEAHADQLQVRTAIHFELPAGSVAHHLVADPPALGGAIRRSLDAAAIRTTRSITCIPGPAAVLKRHRLPIANADRLDALMRAELSELASFGSDSLCIDHYVTESPDDESLELVIAAARREAVRTYLDALESAGLEVAVVDVAQLALANMVDRNHGVDPSRTMAFVHIGGALTELGVRGHGCWRFTGHVGVGLGPGEGRRREPDTAIADVAAEIERALRLYWPESAGDPIDRILLSGGGAAVPGVGPALSRRLGCPVDLTQPFRCVPRRGQSLCAPTEVCFFAVAAGLALRWSEVL